MTVRIQRRAKGWRMPEGAVYVGRPTRWGNPYVLHRYGVAISLELFKNTVRGFWVPELVAATRYAPEAVYREFCEWRGRFRREHPMEALVSELRGKDLVCWCPLDRPCHADVLLELANATAEEQ